MEFYFGVTEENMKYEDYIKFLRSVSKLVNKKPTPRPPMKIKEIKL